MMITFISYLIPVVMMVLEKTLFISLNLSLVITCFVECVIGVDNNISARFNDT
jgi:hypothetical protein